jgi:hypothetical protein
VELIPAGTEDDDTSDDDKNDGATSSSPTEARLAGDEGDASGRLGGLEEESLGTVLTVALPSSIPSILALLGLYD